MVQDSPKVADPPGHVDAGPSEVVTRLRQRLLPIRSLWFPTPRELRAWEAAGVPLYVRRLGVGRFEVGPRLASQWAACFAPVWAAHAVEDPSGTQLLWHRRLPRFTTGLLVGWWLILAIWLAVLYGTPTEEDPGRWMVFWQFLAMASTLGPILGRRWGGQSLDAAMPWLLDALNQVPVDEDW